MAPNPELSSHGILAVGAVSLSAVTPPSVKVTSGALESTESYYYTPETASTGIDAGPIRTA